MSPRLPGGYFFIIGDTADPAQDPAPGTGRAAQAIAASSVGWMLR